MDFELFDTRHYETQPVVDGYGEWAPTYDATALDEMDLELLSRLSCIDWTQVRAAADLGCGTGRIGVWLRDRSAAAIDGVDLTPRMLQAAALKRVYGRLLLQDMLHCSLPDAAYDLVLQVLACEHLPDLRPLYACAARLARPGGRFVLIGYHPYFLLNGVPTHFDRPSGQSVAIRNHVHLLGDHVKAALAAGWSLAEMDERVVDAQWVERRPAFRKYLHRPISFVLAWCKPAP
jgi:SAM-dependent methyltransferase